MSLVRQRLDLPGGELRLLQPDDAAELPDDRSFEWTPLAPYWSVLWRSGMALARVVDRADLAGKRVVELGCGLGVPSLAAARAGSEVLATDTEPDALALVRRNAGENGVALATAPADWTRPAELVARGPFDLVLAADVLYERAAVEPLLALLPRLADEVWLADPGRTPAAEFLDRATAEWSVATEAVGEVRLHRLLARS